MNHNARKLRWMRLNVLPNLSWFGPDGWAARKWVKTQVW